MIVVSTFHLNHLLFDKYITLILLILLDLLYIIFVRYSGLCFFSKFFISLFLIISEFTVKCFLGILSLCCGIDNTETLTKNCILLQSQTIN